MYSNILLKLELLQPSGSFKSRAVGNMMSMALARHSKPSLVHFYSSSGGNAGLACATTAISLGKPATIIVPTTTKPFMVEKLRDLGAEVIKTGENWSAADKYLREEVISRDENGIYVPPFDHPDIWTGVSSMVDEIVAQVDSAVGGIPETKIDAVICNVGGGGLLCGIMEGIHRYKWAGDKKPKVLAMETFGADTLTQSVAQGKRITLPRITSIATSLGATQVAKRTFEWGMSESVVCAAVTDLVATDAAIRFADEARLLVEVACGATIAPVYTGQLREKLGEGMSDEEWRGMNVIVIICGGSNTGMEKLFEYRRQLLL